MNNEATALLRKFVEDWRELIEKDEPIPGSDCVDYVVEFWHRAAKMLDKDKPNSDPSVCAELSTMNQRETMLFIAEQILQKRKELDGDLIEDYDSKNDPEGFVISILTALRHWCHSCRKDWTNELSQAQDLFETDLAEDEPCHVLPVPE